MFFFFSSRFNGRCISPPPYSSFFPSIHPSIQPP
jgi:hypothetical protein